MAGSQQYAITATASLIGSAPPNAINTGPVGWLQILADTTNDVFIGGPGVTSSNGFKITHAVTTPFSVPLFPGDQIFAVTASTATLGVLATGA